MVGFRILNRSESIASRLCSGATGFCLAWTLTLASLTNLVQAQTVGRTRLWVDATGQYSVDGELIEVKDEHVLLRRSDGKTIEIAIELLSDRDQDFVKEVDAAEQVGGIATRLNPPEPPKYKPLPSIRLPGAQFAAPEGTAIVPGEAAAIVLASELPSSVPPDPSPHSFASSEVRVAIPRIDYSDTCSAPIPITLPRDAGNDATSLIASISRRASIPGDAQRGRLLRFDVDAGRAYVVHQHDETIQLLDHHIESGRSLLHLGFNTMQRGGVLAIGSGWGEGGFSIRHRRPLSASEPSAAKQGLAMKRLETRHLRWARWLDSEHVVALIDDKLGVWNLLSGEARYVIDGIETESIPALSGGRHYLAVPFAGHVQLFATETGQALGRIEVEPQVPAVGFSSRGDRLAIVTSRRLRCWDLQAAAITSDVRSRRGLGSSIPIWIDDDLVLSGSGVLVSLFRGLPIWRYDMDSAAATAIGSRIAILRKSPTTMMTVTSLPHPAAQKAMNHIDSIHVPLDRETWRIVGRSDWQGDDWIDRDIRISALNEPQRQ